MRDYVADLPPFSIHMSDGPEGGQEFGYSDGLLEPLGHELLVWTRPTHGMDPGLDWPRGRRSVQLMCLDVLDAAARRTFAIDVPIERSLPNGTMFLTVRNPETAIELRANALAPHTPVAAVSWELRRDDFGPLRPIETSQLFDLIDKCRELVAAVPPHADVPADLVVDADALSAESFSAAGSFGPATPLVRALAASMATAREEVMSGLDLNAKHLHLANDQQHRVESSLSRVGRGAGRSTALSRCDDLAAGLLEDVSPDLNIDLVSTSVRVALKTAALHDLLTVEGRQRGYGPWETTLYFPERPPGQTAPEDVISLVANALAAVPPADVAALIDRHAESRGVEDLDVYGITHPTGLPAGHPLQRHWEDVTGRLEHEVREMVTTLLSATAWRHEDGERDDDLSAYVGWSVFDDYGDLLPRLRELLRLGDRPADFFG
ncbi:hypothetical protein EUA93_10810 [Nocardioides oleivorans]|uniref:Uncharacterized protein n=1 Tax=Nocardioides oleivorans TaxID=273676 RepID=A0A4Q2S0V3_9ACTN|nr:hypothetical protein [Nocardioides oleivorans]RYB94796.1 hypothetical protein EUA93_10810 [Nocardioides oleivorans]